MKQEIITLTELNEKGIKVARLAGNRDFSEKNIKEKKKSLKKCGMLSAAIIISAKKALDEGLEVVDFETGKAITYENADKYVVLVDANHRFKAYLELRKSEDEYDGDFLDIKSTNDLPSEKENLMSFIKDERARELFQEGMRLYDLRRWNERVSVYANSAPAIKFTYTNYEISNLVFPIPSAEINAGFGVTQNNWTNTLPK